MSDAKGVLGWARVAVRWVNRALEPLDVRLIRASTLARLEEELVAHRVRALEEQIRAVEKVNPWGGDESGILSDEWVSQVISTFSDEAFLLLPQESQFSLLEVVQSVYSRDFHKSAFRQARAIERIFGAYCEEYGSVPLGRLLRIYDLLYLLYWCAAVSIEEQRGFDTGVVVPFSRYLERYLKSHDVGPKLTAAESQMALTKRDGVVRLCYLGGYLYEGRGNGLGPVVEGFISSLAEHCRDRYKLFVYAWKEKEKEFLEKLESLGATVRCFDVVEHRLGEYREGELLRLRHAFFEDKVDVTITDLNSSVPHFLFESRVAPFQVLYQLGMPYWRLQQIDLVLQGWQIAPHRLGFAPSRCFMLTAPPCPRQLNPRVETARVAMERARFPESRHTIGFYGRLVKITPEYLRIVGRILHKRPDTIVVVGGTGNPTGILTFVRKNQLEGRLVVVNEFVDGHVWGHFLDVFLDTFPMVGGYSCLEVMAKGKPVVHMVSDEMPNLNALGDPELQARDSDEYVAHVLRLLADHFYYRRAGERAIEMYRKHADSRAFASRFNMALRQMMDRARRPFGLVGTLGTLFASGRPRSGGSS